MQAQAVRPRPDASAAAREHFADLLAYLDHEAPQGMTHSDMERELSERGQELLRQLYQGWLEQQEAPETAADVVDADGTERQVDPRPHERALETALGTVRVQRRG